MQIALSWPGPFELIAVMLLLGVPAALVLLLLRGKRLGGTQRPALHVIAAIEADGPATYRVVGVDKTTRADREITVDASSRANAQVKAELDGILVTAVTKQT